MHDITFHDWNTEHLIFRTNWMFANNIANISTQQHIKSQVLPAQTFGFPYQKYKQQQQIKSFSSRPTHPAPIPNYFL